MQAFIATSYPCLTDLTAQTITDKILLFIAALNCNAVFLGLTTVDGASVLFRQHSGVVARLRKVYSWIVNIHCAAHRLNLIIGKLAALVLPSTIGGLKQLHSCFNAQTTADIFEKLQTEINETVRKIPAYLDIRWTSLFELT